MRFSAYCPPSVRAHGPRPAIRAGWWLGLLCVTAGAAAAQPVLLEPSLTLLERLPAGAQGRTPTVIEGDRLRGRVDERVEVEGNAVLRRHDLTLRADRLAYSAADNTAAANGHVRINRLGDIYEGERLQLKLDTFEGRFDDVRFQFLRSGGLGQASRIDFLDEQRATAHDVQYSTCERPSSGAWRPDWAVTAQQMQFDLSTDTGVATDARLEFLGVPLLATPWISFPLSDARKSGVLTPSFNLDNQSGFEATVPYYLNLAPNRDATLYPTLMSKRGLDLGGEYRYLERTWAGQVRAAWMGHDRLRQRDRWAYAVQHQQSLPGLQWLPAAGLRIQLNRVSDDDYWRDFPRTSTITNLAQRLLANEIALSGGAGAWNYSLIAQRWQTLGASRTLAPVDAEQIVAPYDRLPSLALRYRPQDPTASVLPGWRVQVDLDVTRFRTDRLQQVWDGSTAGDQRTDINGTRWLGVLRLSRRWETPGWYLEPSLQWHARQYRFEHPLGNGRRSATVLLPTATLDTGLVFERDATLFERAVLQTLEPRIVLTATPYRDQRLLPVYDSAAYDFNLGTIFAANSYGGHDRIADLQAITYGVNTRLRTPDDGAELASVGVAQRLRLRDQRVTLPNEGVAAEGRSDILVGATVNWVPQWSLSGTWQYNIERNTSVQTLLSARYTPGPYRVLSAAYRNNESTTARSRQLDVGWQWPLAALAGERPLAPVPGRALGPQQWYGVGRLNYSFTDRRIIDMVAGLEYDAGCWIGRIVLERQQQSSTRANQRVMFQLEFSGFSRLGSGNPLRALRTQIPRYQYLREDINPPSRFERYE